jgi:hypothetical protein
MVLVFVVMFVVGQTITEANFARQTGFGHHGALAIEGHRAGYDCRHIGWPRGDADVSTIGRSAPGTSYKKQRPQQA